MDQKANFKKCDTAVFWEEFWKRIAEGYLHPYRRKGKVPLHILTCPTDLHVCAHRQAQSVLECRTLSLLLGGSSMVCMDICLMMGADSGRQTHPPAQTLVAVHFAVTVLAEDRVAAHIRCALLVKWQWRNSCTCDPSASQISHSLM